MTTEANTQTASDISQMSDEEILNMAPPAVDATQNNPETNTSKTQEELDAEAAAQKQAEADEEARLAQEEEQRQADEQARIATEEAAQANADGTQGTQNTTADEQNGGKVAATKVESNGEQGTKAAPNQNQEGEGKDKQGAVSTESNGLPADFDYKAGYEKLMAPFKANGKMVQARTPEEAIALMQQGANFTRKMQEIAPHRKLLLMLENSGLNDEGQLSFAIDLVKKNPEAIKKLIKDSGLDVMDIDPEAEPQYQEGNHRVSDAEARFVAELGDLRSTPEGEATFGVIYKSWDDASKQALMQNEGLMATIHEQREAGIYDRIVAEIDHQKMLGNIPANVSFIQAYKAVGDALKTQGAFADLQAKKDAAAAPAVAAKAAPAVVATRVAAPKSDVANGSQASAASPSRSAPRKAEALVNPLGMSDEDFLKLPVPKGA
ncbi:putative tape measure protein [Achromobacter phage vB_AxyP_19-32_Axy13]|uniref:Putative tape measure protein n=1 Tax=Achromobacter phage vB_AxyP_19-32_Axy13 TaxID=2591044 RepID=A0A514CUM6_9CAUD|nr:putative tape measure protein [Achromobacter phage vB_AxyP_19-32_Axy13]